MSASAAIVVASFILLCVAIAAALSRRHLQSKAAQAAEALQTAHEQKIRETTRQMSESGRLMANEISATDLQAIDTEQGDQSFEAQYASVSETIEPVAEAADWTSQDLDMDHALSVDDPRY